MEFCSDTFLLPLGHRQIHSISLATNNYLCKDPRARGGKPPTPPPRQHMLRAVPNHYYQPKEVAESIHPSSTTATNIFLDRKQSYYEMLSRKLEFNNNSYVSNVLNKYDGHKFRRSPPPPPERKNILQPIYESHEHEQYI